ncbi:MAG: hypothetical protein JO264_19420 [Acidisphaera sp.]|nr:hypothetical protein [Acidisphaera sp.]
MSETPISDSTLPAGSTLASNEPGELSPLAVLLTLMREKWEAGDRNGAASLARIAAPYLHARRGSLSGRSRRSLEPHRLTDADLARRLADSAGGVAAAPADPDLFR